MGSVAYFSVVCLSSPSAWAGSLLRCLLFAEEIVTHERHFRSHNADLG